MTTFKIAIRNIFRHRTRSIITLSAIAFGCIALIFSGGYFEDVFYKMRESYIHGHTGHLQIYKQGYYEHGAAEPFEYLIDNPKEITDMIKQLDGIKFVTSRIEFAGLLSTGDTTVSFVGQGIEPSNETATSKSEISNQRQFVKTLTDISGMVMKDGEPLKDSDMYSIILGEGLAAGLGVNPGDGLILVTNTIGGSINALDVTMKGTFCTSSKQFDDRFARMPLATAQKLLHTDSVQSIVIMLDKTEDTEKVKSILESEFKNKGFSLEIKKWDELSDFYTKAVDLFNRLFFVLKIIISVIVILSIFNTMNMAVLERTSEIGTIMALGTRRSGVMKLFMYEGFGLGLIGGIIGVISGAAITMFVSHVGIPMPPAPGITYPWVSEPKVVPGVIIFVFFIAIITSLLSSLYPAYKASKLQVADALRHT